MSTGNVVAGVDDLDWDDSSDEFFMPLGGATTDENDRPPFSKGGLQGGRTWPCCDLLLTPSLEKEGGLFSGEYVAQTRFEGLRLFVPEPIACHKHRLDQAPRQKVAQGHGGVKNFYFCHS